MVTKMAKLWAFEQRLSKPCHGHLSTRAFDFLTEHTELRQHASLPPYRKAERR
jgi:hypothetical protein